MVKLIEPLDIYLKDILPYLRESIQKHLGSQEVEVVLITKVGDQVQMRDTMEEGGAGLKMSILMLEGVLESLKGQQGN